MAAMAVGQDEVEGAPLRGIPGGHEGGGFGGRACLEREQGQFPAGALARLRPQAAHPIEHGGHDAMVVHGHPTAATQPVFPADQAGPMGGGWVPGAVQPLIAIGGDEEGPGGTGAMEQDDGAHG